MIIKLSKWAKDNGYTYMGAYLKYKRGQLPGAFVNESNSIFVEIKDPTKPEPLPDVAVIYSRCSSSKQREDAERQRSRLENYAISNGYTIKDSYIEIASGMNEHRKILNKILDRTDYKYLIVENKDRLSRFGFYYIEKYLQSKGVEVIVVNQSTDISNEDELMNDLVSVITSFCARLYGNRRSKNKKEAILGIIKDEATKDRKSNSD